MSETPTETLRPPDRAWWALGRRRARGRWWPTVAAVVIFVVVGMWPQGSVWIHGLGHLTTSQQDGEQTQWFFAWVAFCVTHGHDPLVTHWVNVPQGANLIANTSTLFLAAVFAPLTMLFGATESVNIAFTLAVAAAALATYAMVRRFTSWWPAAFVAGLLVEFSAYLTGQASGHLDLTFMAVPPLVVVVLDAMFVRQVGRAAWWGLALAALVVVQFFTSTEVLASTAIFSAVGLVILLVAFRHQVRSHLAYAARALGWAAGAAVVVLAYPIWLLVAGPDHLSGPVQPILVIDSFRADLLGTLIPTTDQRFNAGAGAYGVAHLAAGNNAENGAYLGAVLVMVALVLAWRARRIPVVPVASALAAAAWVLSLGSRLTYLDRDLGIPLPFTVLTHVPLLDSMFSIRLTFFVALFMALVFAVGLDHLHDQWSGRRVPADPAASDPAAPINPAKAGGALRRIRSAVPTVSCLVVALAVLVPLIPAWPYAPSPVDAVPAYFTGSLVDRVAPGSVVATYPFSYVGPGKAPIAPNASVVAPMVWQAAAHLRFRLVGGYVIVPTALSGFGGAGGAYSGPPSAMRDVLTGDYYGWESGGASPGEVAQTRQELHQWGVGTVIADPVGADPAAAVSFLTAVLGDPPVDQGGVAVWYGVPALLLRTA